MTSTSTPAVEPTCLTALTALRLWLEAMAQHTPQWSVRAGDVW